MPQKVQYRDQKKQKHHYSGKKRQHTLKAQIVVDQNHQILCVNTTNGKEHDFSLYKRSRLPILKKIEAKVDLGYIGIKNFIQMLRFQRKVVKTISLQMRKG